MNSLVSQKSKFVQKPMLTIINTLFMHVSADLLTVNRTCTCEKLQIIKLL